MIITRDIKIRNFEAKLPEDCVGIISVSLNDRTFNYRKYHHSPIYMVLADSIKISGSYPKNIFKRFWFKLMDKIKPCKITIQYYDFQSQPIK